jgi:hypothetical protein
MTDANQRRAAEVPQQPQIGLEAGQQQEQAHADRAERVEQLELPRVGREDGRERVRVVVTEQRRAQGDSRGQLADDRRQAQALRDLGPYPGRRHQQRQLHQQQKTEWPDRPGMGVCKRPGR